MMESVDGSEQRAVDARGISALQKQRTRLTRFLDERYGAKQGLDIPQRRKGAVFPS